MSAAAWLAAALAQSLVAIIVGTSAAGREARGESGAVFGLSGTAVALAAAYSLYVGLSLILGGTP